MDINQLTIHEKISTLILKCEFKFDFNENLNINH